MRDHLKNKKELTHNFSVSDSCECMSDSELNEYLQLIKISYPQLKGSLKDSVMAQIRNSEDGQITQMPADELLRKNNSTNQRRRNKIVKRLVRYGSLAACIAIAAIAGFKLLPSYTSQSVTDFSATADYIMDESATDTSADNYNDFAYENGGSEQETGSLKATAPMMFSAGASDAAIAEENEVDDSEISMYSDIPEDDNTDGSEMLQKNSDTIENATSNNCILYSISSDKSSSYDTEYDSAPYYKYTPVNSCPHSSALRNSYHNIPKTMINLVGETEFNAWAYEIYIENPCGVNISSFYEHFSEIYSYFSDEFVSLLLNGDTAYYCDYPAPELFTEGKFDEIEEYYLAGGDLEKALGNYFEYKFKTALITKAGVSAYTGWLDKCGIKYMSDWSISDITGSFGFTTDELSKIYDDVKAEFLKEYPDAELFGYNFEKIADDAQSFNVKMSSGKAEGRLKDTEYRIYE